MGVSRIRQPAWTRDELILALDLYFRVPAARGNARHPETVRLSRDLNALPIHASTERGPIFRNPNGIGMELMNFIRFDPAAQARGRRGMSHGSKLLEEVWNTFAGSPNNLARTAAAIRTLGKALGSGTATGDEESVDVAEAVEGRILTRVHRMRERNSRLVAAKKAETIKRFGRLACEICTFDFEAVYGDLGRGFAECHHTVALSALSGSRITKLADLLIVCANCHRMIHRSRPWATVAQLRDRLAQQRGVA